MPSGPAPFVYLTLSQILQLIQTRGLGPVTIMETLESAVVQPQVSAFGADAYATLPAKAAALMFSLVRGNPAELT